MGVEAAINYRWFSVNPKTWAVEKSNRILQAVRLCCGKKIIATSPFFPRVVNGADDLGRDLNHREYFPLGVSCFEDI